MPVVYWILRHLVLVLIVSAAVYGWVARDNLDSWLGNKPAHSEAEAAHGHAQ